MDGIRRISANLPAALLREARRATGKGITETVVDGLELVRRSAAARKAIRLKGRLRLKIDLRVSRERARR